MTDETENIKQLRKVEYKYLLYYGIFVTITTVSVSSILIINSGLTPDFVWDNELYHSTVEVFGALIAIFIAIILFCRASDEYDGKFYLMTLGFLGLEKQDAHKMNDKGKIKVQLIKEWMELK